MVKLFVAIPLFMGLATTQILPFDQPLPVLTSPIVQVKAGEDLTYQLFNSRNMTCQGTLTFQNDTFLAISALARPKDCGGDQTAKFRIPKSAPNGPAALEWKCSGVDGIAVDLMVISGGRADPGGLSGENESACVEIVCRSNTTSSHNPQSHGCT